MGSSGTVAYQAVQQALFEADVITRRRGIRNRVAVAQAVHDLMARLTVASIRAGGEESRPLTTEEVKQITTDQLTVAVFGERDRENLGRLTLQYLTRGFGEGSGIPG